MECSYLVEVDDGLPEVVLLLVEVSHTNLTEITRMVFVDVGSVVVLTTGHTTTTGMLAVLADTTVTGRDVATAIKIVSIVFLVEQVIHSEGNSKYLGFALSRSLARSIRRAECHQCQVYFCHD